MPRHGRLGEEAAEACRQKFIMVVRIGSAMMQATTRVTTRYLKASTADASSASICSVTRIAPSSAPMPAPMRPDSSSAGGQRTGLAHQRDRQPGRDHRLGAEALERRARVHREHDADGDAGHGDERRRTEAELVELAERSRAIS